MLCWKPSLEQTPSSSYVPEEFGVCSSEGFQHNIYGALAHKKSLVSVLVKVSNTTYTVLWHIRRAWCLF